MSKKKHHAKMKRNQWKLFYWATVLVIFVSLIFMVRFVLNSSKIYVDKTTVIHPYYIDWSLERDGSLRINEPYYLKTEASFLQEDLDKLALDSVIYSSLILNSKTGNTLRDLPHPYLVWKNENSDTIHVLKNNIVLNFSLIE